MKDKWKKLPGIRGGRHGCLNCGYTYTKLSMRGKIIAGFGGAIITKNSLTIYNEPPEIEWETAPTLMKFENMARKDPDCDWRFSLDLPLRSATYQRHGKNEWVLIEKGMGFA